MAKLLAAKDITIVVETWTDQQGAEKKKWRTIGVIKFFEGDDGSRFEKIKLWGAGGVVDADVFEQKNDQQGQQNQAQGYQQSQQGYQQQQYQQAPQQGYQQQPQQQGYRR